MNARDGVAVHRHEVLIADLRARIEQMLAEATPGEPAPQRLGAAMRYSLLASAKRVRGLLTVLCTVYCGGAIDQALPAACALEMVHTASLILDDLPAMDDAKLRRGQHACHRAHGEATAMLAAIALMNRAYAIVAGTPGIGSEQRARIVGVLAHAIGTDGLTGGQEADLHGAGLADAAEVEWIHARKTGALFAAATEISAIIAGAEQQRETLREFGMQLGLAFQAYDDLLDSRAASAAIGKDTGADARKVTLVSLLGFASALQRAEAQMAAALESCPGLRGDETALGHYLALLVAQMQAPLGLDTVR